MTHFKFWDPNDIPGTAEATVVKFYAHLTDNIPLLKGAWSRSHDPCSVFDARNHISGTAESTVAKFCMQV